MLVNSFTIEQFTTNKEAMGAVAGLVINPTIYRNKPLADIVADINMVLVNTAKPYQIIPPTGHVQYLRFEAERLDRALYILSCLVDTELQQN